MTHKKIGSCEAPVGLALLGMGALWWSAAVAAQPASPPLASRPAAAASAPAASFVLREIKLPAVEAVPAADIQAALRPFIGKPLANSDLSTMVERVRQLYEDRGLGLAAIGLPTQDVTRGTLTLAIVEPKVNRLSLAGSEAPPLAESRVMAVLRAFGVTTGGWLDVRKLDRAMFALNDMPGVAAKATLGAAGEEGAYDLVVEVEPRRVWDAQMELDNHGSDSAGKYRLGGVLRWNNPLHIGDNADLRLLFSNGGGVAVGRLGYEAPLGLGPARLGVGWSRVDYELGDEFAAAGFNGTADVLDASVTYPLLRSRGRNLVGRVGLEHKTLEDRTALDSVKKTIPAIGVGLTYEGRDALGGGGFVGAGMQLRMGHVKFNDEAPALLDAGLGERAISGHFSKLEWQASRLQAITQQVSFHAGLSGQFADKNLDGAEKVTLGGPKGVRSYPKAEGASDEAVLLSTELRWWLTPRWTVFALADAARGRSQKRPDTSDPTVVNMRTLNGVGAGVYFSDPKIFTLTASLARRGSELPITESGDPKQQLFVQLSRAF